MADNLTKTKIIDINTQKADKNVKTLKAQIKDLKNEMAQLTKGTVEYDKAAQKLANLNQKQIEINEAMKYSNKDLGATLSNLTKVTAGVVGAISSVNSVMVMMGADSEEAMEAMKRIQALMAIIQGLGAIDTAVKALKGLTVAFQGFNDVRVKSITTSVGASGAELAEAGALAENTKEMLSNNDIAKAYDTANKENARTTNEAADAIKRETELLTENRKVKSEGDIQLNTHILDEYDSKLRQLRVDYEELSMHSEMWDDDMAKLAGQIDAIEKLSQNYALLNYKQKVYTESIGQGADVEQKALKELGEAQAVLTGDFEKQLVSVRQRMDELDHLQAELGDLYSLDSDEGVKVMEKFNKLNIDGAEYVDRLEDAESALNAEYTKLAATELTLVDAQKEIIKYIPDQQLFDTVSKYNALKAEEAEIDKRNEETYKALSKARQEMFDAQVNGMEDAIEKERQYQEMQAAFNETDDSKRLDEIYAELAGRDELYKSYAKEIEVRKEKGVWTDVEVKQAKMVTDAENAETASLDANTLAKKANADATEDVADAEKKLGTETKKNDPILRKAWSGLTNGIKNAAKAIKAFIATNPILTGMIAAVAAIGAGIALWAKSYNDAHKEAFELKKMNIELDMEFKKQKTDMETLVRMFNQENLTAKEKETLAKEINKLAGDELVARNKITGEWEIQIEKMQEYQRNLRTQIELEYHKKAILEAMDKEEEARQDANYERNHFIGNLFRTETGYLEDAAEAVAEQEKHWKAIEKLTTNVVENIDKENKKLQKNTTGGGGIKKTFADLLKELKALWKDFYAQLTKEKELKRVFNGIYSEALVAYDKAVEAINGSMLGDKISKDFVKSFEKGLKDIKSNEITLDMIFVDVKDLDKQLDDAKNVLRKLFNEGKKVTDKQVQDAKKRIDQIKEEIAGYEAIAKSVYDYKKALEDLEKTRKETNDANALYNKQQEININYKPKVRREQGRDFQYEETNKEIEQQRLLYQTTMKRLTEEKARLDELKQSNLENKATIEEIAELEKKIAEDQKAANEAQMQMDELRYQNRMTELQEEYAAIEKNSEIAQQWYEIEQSIKGGGVADYNIDVDLLEMQLEAIVEKANMVDEYYKKLQEQHDENSQEWYVLEQERLAAQEALQRQYMDKEIEMEQEKSKRKLNIQKAYIAAYQNISSQVSNILGTLMNEYDENSKEYLNLKYAQGVTDTLSGTLAAYMSGIESGLPAPANQILAAVMAASTFAMGVMQLSNIKNGTLANGTATPVQIGNEYDTLSYAQNAEILSSIQDSRVYVLESDVTDTQRRVHVAESAAMF